MFLVAFLDFEYHPFSRYGIDQEWMNRIGIRSMAIVPEPAWQTIRQEPSQFMSQDPVGKIMQSDIIILPGHLFP